MDDDTLGATIASLRDIIRQRDHRIVELELEVERLQEGIRVSELEHNKLLEKFGENDEPSSNSFAFRRDLRHNSGFS